MRKIRQTKIYREEAPLTGQAQIEQRLCQLICRLFFLEPSTFCGRAVFRDELGLDSLDMVELIMHIEQEFRVELADNEWIGLESSEALANLIASKVKI